MLILALFLAKFCEIELFPLTNNLFRDVLLGTFGTAFPLAIFVFLLSKKAEGIPLIGSLRKVVIHDIKVIFTNASLLDIILISIFAGVAEELLFRGIIQVELGIFGASIIFGLLHFITPAYCVIATIMGLYLGFLCHYYQSLLIPIQLHFIYDLGALVYLRYFVKTETSTFIQNQ